LKKRSKKLSSMLAAEAPSFGQGTGEAINSPTGATVPQPMNKCLRRQRRTAFPPEGQRPNRQHG
jgi:hypothetical protein